MKGKKIQMDAPVVLLVFSLFAACVLMVLLTGADAYQRLVERDQTAFDRRSCTQYLATKVRQGDGQGQIWVDTFAEDEGPKCLFLEEDGYLTRIYCYDGWLRELYAQPDSGLEPQDGEQVLQAQDLELSLEDGLLTLTVTTPQGERITQQLSLRSGEGAAA